jgi:hypothetical protein
MCRSLTRFLLLACLTTFAAHAHAGTVLTFEGLKNFEQVANFYDGGTGSLGSGPGPSYGVTFSTLGLAYIPGLQTGQITPFPNDPSPPTVLLLFKTGDPLNAGFPEAMAMNVSGGFTTSLGFYYIAIGRVGSVEVWSGPSGTGTMLAQQALPITPVAFATGPQVLDFLGTAHSVVFKGGNDQFAVENITFLASVPEPASWQLLAVGLCGSLIFFGPWRRISFEHRKGRTRDTLIRPATFQFASET